MSKVIIREYRSSDAAAICDIFEEVTNGGDTYDYAPGTPKETAAGYFSKDLGYKCFVAEIDGQVAGFYAIRPNRPGLASHTGNCSYMVSSKFRGNGVGELLGKHSIEQGRRDGFKGIQFNFVVSTNTVAVKLWQKLGWEIIGTIPGGYQHKDLGFVDAYIMYRKL